MKRPIVPHASVADAWGLARSGDLRGGVDAVRAALEKLRHNAAPADCVELHLAAAFCLMRQGHLADAIHELDAADRAATSATSGNERLALHIEIWRAELAYFQGRYSVADDIINRRLDHLEKTSDWAYAAFALRIRIAILLARADYDEVAALSDRAIHAAEASRDDYIMVQILNVLGAVRFDCATSKLPEPHARAHLSALDPRDAAPMESDAREALRLFERARAVAERGHFEFAAWYVAGNIERLQILLGHAERAVRAIRKRLGILQARGAKYDEIVTRSNLAWGLRTLGCYPEALHELDVAFDLVRETGTFNVLLEFILYDRSIVLYALGDIAEARKTYRRYLQLVGAWNLNSQVESGAMPPTAPKRPLEPYFLKQADRFIAEHIGDAIAVGQLAAHCGVSCRTLEKAFADFRRVTPVAHTRNMRLDQARQALEDGNSSVADIAARHGFQSSTTFSLEYRKRFGVAPSRMKRALLRS
ncbi:MAG: helix-turn-helix transcriptional regulator [Casimicrobiaceae bacterium]